MNLAVAKPTQGDGSSLESPHKCMVQLGGGSRAVEGAGVGRVKPKFSRRPKMEANKLPK